MVRGEGWKTCIQLLYIAIHGFESSHWLLSLDSFEYDFFWKKTITSYEEFSETKKEKFIITCALINISIVYFLHYHMPCSTAMICLGSIWCFRSSFPTYSHISVLVFFIDFCSSSTLFLLLNLSQLASFLLSLVHYQKDIFLRASCSPSPSHSIQIRSNYSDLFPASASTVSQNGKLESQLV